VVATRLASRFETHRLQVREEVKWNERRSNRYCRINWARRRRRLTASASATERQGHHLQRNTLNKRERQKPHRQTNNKSEGERDDDSVYKEFCLAVRKDRHVLCPGVTEWSGQRDWTAQKQEKSPMADCWTKGKQRRKQPSNWLMRPMADQMTSNKSKV